MKSYIEHHPWEIIENSFDPRNNPVSESLFSLGNGHMGLRGNFEEQYSGKGFRGSYLAGIYYPDKTRVGWWKNGYPEYFAKVLNSPNWIGIHVVIDNNPLDLHLCKIHSFSRILDMKRGVLHREVDLVTQQGIELTLDSQRFVSMERVEIGAINYSVTVKNKEVTLELIPYIDGNVQNEDSNYDEIFWDQLSYSAEEKDGYIECETRKTAFRVGVAMDYSLQLNSSPLELKPKISAKLGYVAHGFQSVVASGSTLSLQKYACLVTSRDYEPGDLHRQCKANLKAAVETQWEDLLQEHISTWESKWHHSDVVIEGDVASQQGIRYNIFQLNQTYTGRDSRLNIGPKGFTGEKYGGATYWDTEAFCFPFYLSTAEPSIAKNLLLYRYNQLPQAIKNAEKLGFSRGAALYPMVTMNGEECHNEWEITFEEIHRNGAMAYAIYSYVSYVKDFSYLADYGLEVLIALSRFWSQLFQFSEQKKQYVMLGVTGPNEYENNVNNNWYTSYIARWTLEYTLDIINKVKAQYAGKYQSLCKKIHFDEEAECDLFHKIIQQVYLPNDETRGIFLQQDGFLDKDLTPVAQLSKEALPLNQKWSWDRILRSCYIKQADVLQGLYMFNHHFDEKTILDNFDFYEPLTVHESSLSPSVHSVIASRLSKLDKAMELYLRTARLDLDNYNNDT
ncbi:MAG: family 65 glycosyl hydrolase domain-containing protein, partial [Spirochaetaceae bacterium]|nr:family 65 glycosyl hydrolase domain-containing protein [Spirochaetaceae bacterium]